jgi:two-component system, OmpR family, sensor kinase
MRSLRIRLLWLLGTSILLATALQFASTFSASLKNADTVFDYLMQQMAMALQDSTPEQPDEYTLGSVQRNEFDFVIQIWTAAGVRVYQPRAYRELPPRAPLGYSTATLDNGDWRVYAVQADKRIIQVSQKLDRRRDRAISLALRAVWPIVPVGLLLLAAAWWVVSAALAPLNRIGRDLAQRDADSVAQVSDHGAPIEVSPLVAELNSLLNRMAGALQSQQRFVADAAHELRSPLTALKLQLQTLARARDDAARTQAMERLVGGVDRAVRLVEQLLLLARQDPAATESGMHEVSLTDCVRQAAADMASLAAARQITLESGALDAISVRGDPDSLRILARNLLDNAVRYTPEGGTVRIGVAVEGETAVLTVADSGIGIPEDSRGRVFDRFYRVPGTGVAGSGLGLAIVKAIAERHGASIAFATSTLGGLKVTVALPAVALPTRAPFYHS